MRTKRKASKRKVLAWVLFIGSCIGWPVSAFTFAASEPPSILALSWIAIIITSLFILIEVD